MAGHRQVGRQGGRSRRNRWRRQRGEKPATRPQHAERRQPIAHPLGRLGPGKVEEAFALGRFNTFAREAQRSGNAKGLEAKTHTVFAPLFRDPADTKAPKLEGCAFQETLNTLGPRGEDDWTPLKVDNWIGPKTTEAFGKVLKTEDADGITAAFGRGLGFL